MNDEGHAWTQALEDEVVAAEREAHAEMRRLEKAESEATTAWNDALERRNAVLAARLPHEDELVYAHVKCTGCGAPLAYWKDLGLTVREWRCARVVLGRALPGEEHSEALPFAFWKVTVHEGKTTL